MILWGFLVFLLVVAVYLIPGLFVSRGAFRQWWERPEDFDVFDPDDIVPLLLIIAFWPLYLAAVALVRFYRGADTPE